jgi:hypothetical protein
VKTYSTGEVARICKSRFKNAREVAKLVDSDDLEGKMVDSKYCRRRTRRIPLRVLLKFMVEQNISFDGFDDGDIEAQKAVLCHRISELEAMIEKARRRSGVFFGFKGLPGALLDVVHNLDPLNNLRGVSEDRRRAWIFKELVEVMERHIYLRGRIATSKK